MFGTGVAVQDGADELASAELAVEVVAAVVGFFAVAVVGVFTF